MLTECVLLCYGYLNLNYVYIFCGLCFTFKNEIGHRVTSGEWRIANGGLLSFGSICPIFRSLNLLGDEISARNVS